MLLVILLQLLLVIWFIRYLFRRDKGPREPFLAVLYAGILGVFAVLVAGTLNGIVLPIIGLPSPGQSTAGVSIATLIIGCLAIGIIEESSKALPLKRFLARKGYFNEVGDGIIYFSIAGLIFGAIENIFYALMFGSEVGLSRLITVPFMHAGFSGIVGYFLARQRVLGRPAWTAQFGLILAIGLHAFYDFGLFYGQDWSRLTSLALIVIINTIVFYLYRRARRTDLALASQP